MGLIRLLKSLLWNDRDGTSLGNSGTGSIENWRVHKKNHSQVKHFKMRTILHVKVMWSVEIRADIENGTIQLNWILRGPKHSLLQRVSLLFP